MDFSEQDMARVLNAIAFSARRHSAQRRKGLDKAPYINHPIDVADILWRVGGIRDLDSIIAALLHDTIEDTDTTPEEIRGEFGSVVTDIVLEVSDDRSLGKDERKQQQIDHAPELSVQARSIKIADKISNITDILDAPPAGWSITRRREYVEWGRNVVDNIPEPNKELLNYFNQVYATAVNELGEDE